MSEKHIMISEWLICLIVQYFEQIIGVLWIIAGMLAAIISYFSNFVKETEYGAVMMGFIAWVCFFMGLRMLWRSKQAFENARKDAQCTQKPPTK